MWYYIGADGIMATNVWIDDVYYVNEAGEWRVENQDTAKNSQGVGWNEDGTFNWGDGGASENLTSGGPITEEEKAAGQNF